MSKRTARPVALLYIYIYIYIYICFVFCVLWRDASVKLAETKRIIDVGGGQCVCE